ncbi:MAG: metal ABC transporter substrate-binding protein [Planctomycetota bacterium]|jgi:zinc transport system substrate-binding protein
MSDVTRLVPVPLLTLALLAGVSACRERSAAPAPDARARPVVYAVNYPLQYFAGRIAGTAAEVRFPAPPGEDPAFWMPDASTIAAYQQADLILLNGADYAKWESFASLPPSRLVNTSAAFADALIRVEEGPKHSHGPEGDHSHSGIAFTTWLDFEQAIIQAAAIHDSLVRVIPDQAAALAANLGTLREDLRDLDARMTTLAERLQERPLLASHPVYQYWARRYHLNIRSLTWEPEVVPDARALSELDSMLTDHPATIMIWEGPPDPRIIELLEARDIRSVVFEPCAGSPVDGAGFIGVMVRNLANLEAASSPTAARPRPTGSARCEFTGDPRFG